MPVRLLSSPVIRWPDRWQVHQALMVWARKAAGQHDGLSRVGYIGSYARGEEGVGSDLDVVIVLRACDQPFIRRGVAWDLTELPVPADVLVYTTAEWGALSKRGNEFRKMLKEVQWVYRQQ
jgi:uncharacterized protein